MYEKLWKSIYGSVCSITFYTSEGPIGSGTGFKVGTKLVTNYHVFQHSSVATKVEMKFVDEDGYTIKALKQFSTNEFRSRLLKHMPENSWDYAILNLNFPEFSNISSLELYEQDTFKIGQQIAVFGFQLGDPNLSIHAGILSSRFIENGVKYLQLDTSVNNGNSGGPLIDLSTERVIGIVTAKATGLTKSFDMLMNSFEQNIKILKDPLMRGFSVSGVDILEAFRVTQEQMKITAREIERSANVGIGFAYELEKVRCSLASLT